MKHGPDFAHPCFCNNGADVARMHLAVAPLCNIKCSFCTPTVDACIHGCKPGVSAELLTPQQAVQRFEAATAQVEGGISIVGIAGPGEPLYNPQTFQTLSLLHSRYPKLHLCLSTNGLLLPVYATLLRQLGVETLTVTVNAATVETATKIYQHVMQMPQQQGMEQLLHSQQEGIRLAVESGLIVKVNSVYVPGVNDEDIPIVAKRSAEQGVLIHNILPLLPRDGMADHAAPSTCELNALRKRCAEEIDQFVRCRHCRADAVVLPTGKEIIFA